MNGPDRALVFVVQGSRGPILESTGRMQQEVVNGGHDMCDHNIPKPPRVGLLIFQGWVEVGAGPDPDVNWVGQWRELTHWEMCQLRFGNTLWT